MPLLTNSDKFHKNMHCTGMTATAKLRSSNAISSVTKVESKVRGFIAHRREAPLMRYRFTYVGADLRTPTLQPYIQRTLRDHGYGLVYRAICLFTSPAYAGYLFQHGQARLSRPRCLVPRRGGLPFRRRSTLRH